MIFRFFIFLAFALSLQAIAYAAEPTATNDRNTLSSYKLGAGDVVTIRVFGEEELSREKIKLTDAGTVPYPVLGELRVLGLTAGDLERMITEGLKGRYLVNPRVSVTIDEYRPFFISGYVDKPGNYPYQPDLTIRKAISIAGGLKERASTEKIFLIKADDRTQTAKHADMSTLVFPGDSIIIDQSFF